MKHCLAALAATIVVFSVSVSYAEPPAALTAASITGKIGGPSYKMSGTHVDMHAVDRLMVESEAGGKVMAGDTHRTLLDILGKFSLDKDAPPEDSALAFIERHRAAFGLKDPKSELKLEDNRTDKIHHTHLSFQQVYKGVPVWKSLFVVHIDKDSNIYHIVSGNVPTPDMDTTPGITDKKALDIALADRSGSGKPSKTVADLCIYDGKLAYHVRLDYYADYWEYFMDAATGGIIKKYSMKH